MPTNVSGWVASSYDLNPFQGNSLPILRPPKAVLLSDLSDEGDDDLSAVLVLVRKVDFITEDNESLVGLVRPEDNT